MRRGLRQLVERQIARARGQGKLQGLQGEGKPLPPRKAETNSEAATSAGFRIMAEAGVLPEEFELKKQLDTARKRAGKSPTEQDLARIADLELRYNIAVEARRRFMR